MMPRSFLVRLRPTMERSTAESNTDLYKFDWNSRSGANIQSSNATSLKKPVNATGHTTAEKQTNPIISPNVTIANRDLVTLELGNHPQSHPNIMRSLHNQSNSVLVMTSHHSNQSGISTGRGYHHVRPTFEIAMPPQYHMQHYPSWCQHDWLPHNNTEWCYPPNISHSLQQRHPREVESMLCTGEVAAPFYSKNKALYRAHDRRNERKKVSDASKYAASMKKFFTVEQMRATRHPERNHTTGPATTLELPPRDHAYTHSHTQKQIGHTEKQNQERNNEKPAQINEPFISDKTDINNGTTIVSCQTAPCNPDNQQLFSDNAEEIQYKLITRPSSIDIEKVQNNSNTQLPSHNFQNIQFDFKTQQFSDNLEKTQYNVMTQLSTSDNLKSDYPEEINHNLITQPSADTFEKVHSCKQCNKTFNRASNLRAHMKTHSEHKPYKCDYCGKGFHQKIDKRIHHYTHTGEKPHKCTKCGRGFKQLTHLNYHMRTHSDTHMYHCTYCGKGFNQKGNLQAHIYGHTGQRPFKCEVCGKGFTLRSTLNTHLRTHAQKKPFVCEYCDKAFYQKNALKMHHIASHPIVNGKSIL